MTINTTTPKAAACLLSPSSSRRRTTTTTSSSSNNNRRTISGSLLCSRIPDVAARSCSPRKKNKNKNRLLAPTSSCLSMVVKGDNNYCSTSISIDATESTRSLTSHHSGHSRTSSHGSKTSCCFEKSSSNNDNNSNNNHPNSTNHHEMNLAIHPESNSTYSCYDDNIDDEISANEWEEALANSDQESSCGSFREEEEEIGDSSSSSSATSSSEISRDKEWDWTSNKWWSGNSSMHIKSGFAENVFPEELFSEERFLAAEDCETSSEFEYIDSDYEESEEEEEYEEEELLDDEDIEEEVYEYEEELLDDEDIEEDEEDIDCDQDVSIKITNANGVGEECDEEIKEEDSNNTTGTVVCVAEHAVVHKTQTPQPQSQQQQIPIREERQEKEVDERDMTTQPSAAAPSHRGVCKAYKSRSSKLGTTGQVCEEEKEEVVATKKQQQQPNPHTPKPIKPKYKYSGTNLTPNTKSKLRSLEKKIKKMRQQRLASEAHPSPRRDSLYSWWSLDHQSLSPTKKLFKAAAAAATAPPIIDSLDDTQHQRTTATAADTTTTTVYSVRGLHASGSFSYKVEQTYTSPGVKRSKSYTTVSSSAKSSNRNSPSRSRSEELTTTSLIVSRRKKKNYYSGKIRTSNNRRRSCDREQVRQSLSNHRMKVDQ